MSQGAQDHLLGEQLDEYRLEALLGQSGITRLYRGVDVELGRYIAVKIIDAPSRAGSSYMLRFHREAQAIANLDHPHIVTIYRYGEAQGLLYVAMQYIEGADLQDILSSYREDSAYIAPADAAHVIREICQALDYAHSKGVIHRNVKPSNVMLDQQGNAYLTDFGLAAVEEHGGAPSYYISPEQAISPEAARPESDLFAVGVMMYEMFTGALPFDAPEPAAMHQSEPPPPRTLRPDLGEALEAVILKALAREPENRYPNGAAIAGALDQALAAQETAPPASHLPLSRRVALALKAHPLPPAPASVTETPHVPIPALEPAPAPTPDPSPAPTSPTQKPRYAFRAITGIIAFTFLVIAASLISRISSHESDTPTATSDAAAVAAQASTETTNTQGPTPDVEATVNARLTEAAAAELPTATPSLTATPTPSPDDIESTVSARLTEAAEAATAEPPTATPSLTATSTPSPDVEGTVSARLTEAAAATANAPPPPTASPAPSNSATAPPSATAPATATDAPTPTAQAAADQATPEDGEETACEDAPRSQLVVGEGALIAGSKRDLFDAPAGTAIMTLLETAMVIVEDGPECADDQFWWKVRTTNGAAGWISEGMRGTYFALTCPINAIADHGIDCPEANPSRMRAGQDQLRPLVNALRVRSEPGLDGLQMGTLQYYQLVTVTNGPVCEDGLIWWQIRTEQGRIGWLAEATQTQWLTVPEPWFGCQE